EDGRPAVPASAIVYVGDLARMRAFYQRCFGLAVTDSDDEFCCLESHEWALTLVASADAIPDTQPAPRRTQTPIKLAFAVASIADLRPIVDDLGGQVAAPDDEWWFQNRRRCDALDPKGN